MSQLPNGTNIQIDNYTANWRVHEKTKQQHDVEFKGEILCRRHTLGIHHVTTFSYENTSSRRARGNILATTTRHHVATGDRVTKRRQGRNDDRQQERRTFCNTHAGFGNGTV